MKRIFFTIMIVCSMIKVIAQPATPLKDSTVGLFSTDLDNVVSVTGWSGIDFTNVLMGASYGYVSEGLSNGLPVTTFNGNVLNAGGIFEAGPVRVGAAYTGALGSTSEFSSTTNETTDSTSKLTKKISDHSAYVLVGIPVGNLNLGLRTGLNVSGTRETTEENSKLTTDQKSLSIRPSIMLGTSLDIADGWAITPTLNFGFTISDAWRTFTTVAGSHFSSNLPEEIRSYKAYIPSGELGIGVTFPTEKFAWSGQLTYGFEYGFMPEKMYQKVNQDQTVDEHIYRTDERIKNTITLHTTGRKVFMDKLTLAARAYIQTSIDKWISGGTQRVAGNQEPSQTMEQTDIVVLPRLYLAGTYQLNEKVSMGAGLSFDPATYEYSQSASYDEDVPTSSPKTSGKSHKFKDPLLSNLGFSMTFTPIQEFSVQLGVTLQAPKSWIDVLDGNIRLSATWKK